MDITYQRIRELRISKGMTQEALSKLTGYGGRSAINRIEAGVVDLPLSKITLFASALNTTTEYLTGMTNCHYKEAKKMSELIEDPEIASMIRSLIDRPELQELIKVASTLNVNEVRAAITLLRR